MIEANGVLLSGIANSPTSLNPSEVVSVSGIRSAGSTEFATIFEVVTSVTWPA